jgi:ATP-dependent 26S proteasome regulatory subunit
MNTLLNLTDGIIGDSLNLHFICTFNTNVNNIDKALLRKGRLSYMYEFEPLTLEKTREWIPDAKKSMTIADIFNYNVENNANVENRPIGFQN